MTTTNLYDTFIKKTAAQLVKCEQLEKINTDIASDFHGLLVENTKLATTAKRLSEAINDKDKELQLLRRKQTEDVEARGKEITAQTQLLNAKYDVSKFPFIIIVIYNEDI